jgi:hypothetical protein
MMRCDTCKFWDSQGCFRNPIPVYAEYSHWCGEFSPKDDPSREPVEPTLWCGTCGDKLYHGVDALRTFQWLVKPCSRCLAREVR